MKTLFKIVSLLLLTTQVVADSVEELLLQHKISHVALLELQDGKYTEGKIFDVKAWMNKPPFEKKDYPICSDEDYIQQREERYLNSMEGWEYLGSTGLYHVIMTHTSIERWHYDTILVLKIVDEGITITSMMSGNMSPAKLYENNLIYSVGATGTTLFDLVGKDYPDLPLLISYMSGVLKEYEHRQIGWCTLHCSLNKEGVFGSEQLISYTPWEGWPPYSGKEYDHNNLKDLLIQMSKDEVTL